MCFVPGPFPDILCYYKFIILYIFRGCFLFLLLLPAVVVVVVPHLPKRYLSSLGATFAAVSENSLEADYSSIPGACPFGNSGSQHRCDVGCWFPSELETSLPVVPPGWSKWYSSVFVVCSFVFCNLWQVQSIPQKTGSSLTHPMINIEFKICQWWRRWCN